MRDTTPCPLSLPWRQQLPDNNPLPDHATMLHGHSVTQQVSSPLLFFNPQASNTAHRSPSLTVYTKARSIAPSWIAQAARTVPCGTNPRRPLAGLLLPTPQTECPKRAQQALHSAPSTPGHQLENPCPALYNCNPEEPSGFLCIWGRQQHRFTLWAAPMGQTPGSASSHQPLQQAQLDRKHAAGQLRTNSTLMALQQ